jgi:hypothetical protein
MSIKYIKENIKKFDHDNLISFLFDIVIRGGLDDVEDFDETKTYYENEKVYYKDVKGVHHIYKCVVEIATLGRIINDEWIDLLESFRKPIISEETFVSEIEVKEEVIVSTEDNQTEFVLTTPGVVDDIYTLIVFHPEHGRLAKSDYYISGQTIILDDEYAVTNIGEKIIVDLYRKN